VAGIGPFPRRCGRRFGEEPVSMLSPVAAAVSMPITHSDMLDLTQVIKSYVFCRFADMAWKLQMVWAVYS
jgi:hypothetical protein